MKSIPLTSIATALLLSSAAAHADVSISNKPTQNMSCDAGVCTATAAKAVLNVGDLQTMLASGDATVRTGSIAPNIDIDQPLTWANTSRLTLDAQQSVIVKKPVSVTGTGALTITTNDGGQSGDFVIEPKASVQLWDPASSLMIDGNNYVLVDDINTLAADIGANTSGFYALAKPYDASGDGTYEGPPISKIFYGTFEGLGNFVSNASFSTNQEDQSEGLFYYMNGWVRDFSILQSSMHAGAASEVGMLAGGGAGEFTRCHVTGTVTVEYGGTTAGGLIGVNNGNIVASSADVKLHGTGGVDGDVGGLAGYNGGSITSSYALGTVSVHGGYNEDLGGLIGYNYGTVENSFAENHVANGKQSDVMSFGGLIGINQNNGRVASSYAAGKITTLSGNENEEGGLVGSDGGAEGAIKTSYWDLDMGVNDPSQGAGNIPNDPGATGLRTRQLQKRLPRGFDPKIWGHDPTINNGYPYLLANPPPK